MNRQGLAVFFVLLLLDASLAAPAPLRAILEPVERDAVQQPAELLQVNANAQARIVITGPLVVAYLTKVVIGAAIGVGTNLAKEGVKAMAVKAMTWDTSTKAGAAMKGLHAEFAWVNEFQENAKTDLENACGGMHEFEARFTAMHDSIVAKARKLVESSASEVTDEILQQIKSDVLEEAESQLKQQGKAAAKNALQPLADAGREALADALQDAVADMVPFLNTARTIYQAYTTLDNALSLLPEAEWHALNAEHMQMVHKLGVQTTETRLAGCRSVGSMFKVVGKMIHALDRLIKQGDLVGDKVAEARAMSAALQKLQTNVVNMWKCRCAAEFVARQPAEAQAAAIKSRAVTNLMAMYGGKAPMGKNWLKIGNVNPGTGASDVSLHMKRSEHAVAGGKPVVDILIARLPCDVAAKLDGISREALAALTMDAGWFSTPEETREAALKAVQADEDKAKTLPYAVFKNTTLTSGYSALQTTTDARPPAEYDCHGKAKRFADMNLARAAEYPVIEVLAKHDEQGDPITDIKVLADQDEVPAGYFKLPINCNTRRQTLFGIADVFHDDAESPPTFLAFKTEKLPMPCPLANTDSAAACGTVDNPCQRWRAVAKVDVGSSESQAPSSSASAPPAQET